MGPETARLAIDKVQRNLLEVMEKNEWPVTFSIGVVTFTVPPGSVDEMIQRADAAMYGAKNRGKNGIRQVVWEGLRPTA